MPAHLREIIDPVLQRNSYFGHIENVLLSMLFDKNMNYRQKACDSIIKARRSNVENNDRVFKTCDINLNGKLIIIYYYT